MINIINQIEENDKEGSPDKGADSRMRAKKGNQTATDLGQGETGQKFWKRDEFMREELMEKAQQELEPGKLKGFKSKKK